jgi:hypothetical protein
VESVDGNAKLGAKFWGDIAATNNATIEPHRQQTPKQLKDHLLVYNVSIFLFNHIYNQELSCQQNGIDDTMLVETAQARYKQRAKHEFKHFHWWEAVKKQPKWSVKFGGTPNFDVTKRLCVGSSCEYSSGYHDTEEVWRPMCSDRANFAPWKGKGKASSNSQSENESSGMRDRFKSLRQYA